MIGPEIGLAVVAALAWGRLLGAQGSSRSLFRLAVESVAAHCVVSTLVSVALVSGGVFRVAAAQAVAAAVPLAFVLLARPARRGLRDAPWITRRELIALLLLVLVSPIALPRMAPLYMENDAGVYSSRAIHHLYEGTLAGAIPVRDQLEGWPLQLFDQDNFYRLQGRERFLPGTYQTTPDRSRFVFQFFPGWPMMMAQWAGMFGLSRMFDAVLFSFLMAVLFFGFLLEARGLRGLPFATTMALVASSPLLLYFSRYTTTEAFLLFLFLFVMHFFFQEGRMGITLAALGLAALVVTHVSTFLYAPLVLLVALHGYRTADRRAASFAASAFAALLVGLPLGFVFSSPYVLDVYRSAFRSLPVDDPARLGLALVAAAYVVGLTLSLMALRRIRAGETPRPDVHSGAGPRWMRWTIRLALMVIAAGTVWRTYQLGWTDRFTTGGGAWAARRLYAGQGWAALPHVNFTSLMMSTSLVGLALVLALATRRGEAICAAPRRGFLLAAVLLPLGIYTLVGVDTPVNYYASRYFIPVFVPATMLLFGELMEGCRVRRRWVIGLGLAGLAFNLTFDRALYRYPVYADEMRVVEDVAARIGRDRVVFLRNPKRNDPMTRRLLALPLTSAYGISVVNVVNRPEVPVDQLIAEYARQLELRDAAVLCRRPPPDGRPFEAVHFSRGGLAPASFYPLSPTRYRDHSYYIYNLSFE